MYSCGLIKIVFEEREPTPEGLTFLSVTQLNSYIFRYTLRVFHLMFHWGLGAPIEIVIFIKMTACPFQFILLSERPSCFLYGHGQKEMAQTEGTQWNWYWETLSSSIFDFEPVPNPSASHLPHFSPWTNEVITYIQRK